MDTTLFDSTVAFAGFSVDDVDRTATFYRQTLGLRVEATEMPGVAFIHLPGGAQVVLYAKPDHQPATYTALNFPVTNVDAAVAELTSRGVEFLHYAGTPLETDERGIFRGGGPLIAWFTDPAGNVIAVLEDPATA